MDAEGEFDLAAIAGIVERPRLYRILNAELVRVCVVQAPGGSGKTTLLRGWMMHREQVAPMIWVPLAAVSSRQAFWDHVAASAVRLGTLSPRSAAWLKEQLIAAIDPVEIAKTLLTGNGPAVLILDGYEQLGPVRDQIDADLTQLLLSQPELRVVVTTRANTDLVDLNLPDGSATRLITMGDLALTTDEISQLILAQTGIDDPRLSASIARATGGYALTVRAAVLALTQLGHAPRLDSREWEGVVAAKLDGMLPAGVPVSFVAETSVPPYVDVALATELTGRDDAAALLDTLERDGFGRWIPYAPQQPVFQYVETIRAGFRTRIGHDPERFARSCALAARWLLDNDDVDQALMLAVEGGDYGFADRAFVPLVTDNPDSYLTDRFLATLRTVPEEALRENPMLAFGLGLALWVNPILSEERMRAFRIAIESTARHSYLQPDADAFLLAAMKAISRRMVEDYRGSAEASLRIVRMTDELDPAIRARFGEPLGTVLRQLSFSLWLGGEIDEAIATVRRSVALCTSQTSRNYAIVYAAGVSAFAGDVIRARSFLGSVDHAAWPDEHRARPYLKAPSVIAQCFDLLDGLDFAGTLTLLRESGVHTRTTEFWPLLTAISVSARHGMGQALAEAQWVTQELASRTPASTGDNAVTEHLYAVLASAWMGAGDVRTAGRLLDAQPADSPYLAGARISRLLGDERDRDALHLAETALELPGHTVRTRAQTQTIAAVAAARQGDLEAAWLWLNSAAVAAESFGARMHVATLAARDRRLLWELCQERGAVSLQRYLEVPGGGASGDGRSGVSVSLTPREGVVLRSLVEHESIRAIADALVVSPHTIKAQLQRIYRKLGVSSRGSAIVVARELGLLESGSARRMSPSIIPDGGV